MQMMRRTVTMTMTSSSSYAGVSSHELIHAIIYVILQAGWITTAKLINHTINAVIHFT